MVVVLFAVSEHLERNCSGLSRQAVAGVLAMKPDKAILADSGAHCHQSVVPPLFPVHVHSPARPPIHSHTKTQAYPGACVRASV